VHNFVSLAAPQVTRIGGTLVATIYVPPTATDMSTYVAQAVAAGANELINIDTNPHTEAIMTALSQQGIGPDRLQVAMGLPVAIPSNLKRLGAVVVGQSTNYQSASVDDLSNAGIVKYRKEMKAAGSSALVTPIGLIPWSMMHVVADLMQGSTTMDSATVFNKMNTAKVNRPELPPVDFSKPAFAGDPNFGTSLGGLRIFSRDVEFWQIVKGGKAAPVSGFVDATQLFKPKKPKKV
jgi:ABC-type branched-subunit amino acid transport system substrate-binding protein